MPARTDQYFVPEDSEMEVKYLPKGKLAVIETIYGMFRFGFKSRWRGFRADGLLNDTGHIGGGGGGTKEDDKFIDDHVREFISK